MDWEQWQVIVGELNTSFLHQIIEPDTARSWFRTLEPYPPMQVARAAERAKAAQFLSLYVIVEAIKDEQREYQATRSTAPLDLPAKGVPPGPEWSEMRKVLERSMLLPGHPDHLPGPVARQRLDELHRYRVARLAEQTTAPRRERP
jgi:hypothetical protein